MRVVPALDELEEGQLGFGLRLKAPPAQQLAFEVAKKLSHIALSSSRRPSPLRAAAGFLAAQPEGDGRVPGSLDASSASSA